MTPAQIVNILRARKLATLAMIALAVAAAAAVKFTTGKLPTGSATVQIMVDSRHSELTDLKQDATPLITRAAVFAQLMASQAVLPDISRAAGIPARDVTSQGPYGDAGLSLDVIAPAEARSSQLIAEKSPYRLTFLPRQNQPVVTALIQAPDPAAAARLANAVFPGVSAYVAAVQRQTPSIRNRLSVRQLGPVQVGTINGGSRLPLMGGAAIAVLVLGIMSILAVEAVRRTKRELAQAAPASSPARKRRGAIAAITLLGVATVAGLGVGYRPSLSPLGLHPRGLHLGAAEAQIMVDTRDSEIADVQSLTSDNSYLGAQLALNYLFFLKSDAARAALGRAVGLRNQSIAASGPFTLLIGRTNLAREPATLTSPQLVNHGYRLLLDVDGARPVLTLYAQAPSEKAAVILVDTARAMLAQEIARREAHSSLPSDAAVVLRPLGSTVGGGVESGASWQLMALVFALVVLVGASLLVGASHRRLRRLLPGPPRLQLDRLDVELQGGDVWPHTRRIMPWFLAGFMAMLFLVPFDAIQLPFHLPVNSTLDRPIVIALVATWLASLRVARGALRPRVKLTRVHYAGLVFLALCFASLALNGATLTNMGEVTLVVKKLALLISYLAFFFVVSSVLRPREVPKFASLMVVLGVVVAIGTIIEYRTHYNPFYGLLGKIVPLNLPNLLDARDSIGRLTVYGPTQQPLELASMLAMVLPFAVLGAMDATTRRRRTLYVIAVALLIAGGVATARKTSVVVPTAVFVLLIAFRPRLLRMVIPLLAVLVIGVHFASPAALGSVISELAPGHVNTALTTTDRTARYDAVTPDLLRHPLIGRGYESYDPQKYRILDNQYLDLLITVGAIGTFGYLAILGAMMSAARRTIRGSDQRRASLALAAVAAVAAIAVASALFDTLSFPHVPYLLFFVAAMITALRERSPAGVTRVRVPTESAGGWVGERRAFIRYGATLRATSRLPSTRAQRPALVPSTQDTRLLDRKRP